MANLETLELTISSNAASASQGIYQLIGSLSSLSGKVGKAVSGLRLLNRELSSLKNAKIPDFSGVTGSTGTKQVERSTKALQDNVKAQVSVANTAKRYSNGYYYNDESLAASQAAALKKRLADMNKTDLANKNNIPSRLGEDHKAQRFIYPSDIKKQAESTGEKASEALKQTKQEIKNVTTETKKATTETNNAAKAAEKVTKTIKEGTQEAAKASDESTKSGGFLENMKQGFENLTAGISNFFSRVSRIATTMLIRKALKALVAAAKEGTTNLYQYSKGLGSEFASSMDSMASSLSQLKNAAGTAIAPALSAIIPVLNSISSAAITAFNALSQLFALLGGSSTWTKATAVVEEYAAATESAGGGGGLKEMLADFDELNVIASESGGGGGGSGSGIDYADMFEEVSVFSSEIRDIVNWIKDNMETIKGIAVAIGTALLAWKVSEAFAGLISQLAGIIAAGAIVAVTCQVVWALDNQYLSSGNVGWLIADVLTTALGAALAGKILSTVIGGGAGYLGIAFTLELSALTSIVALIKNTDTSVLSKESLLLAITGALKAGAGISVLAYMAGASGMNAVITGASTAFIVFGVTIGLKAIFDPNIEDLSTDHIKAAILAGITTGVGVGIIAMKGFGATWGAAAAAASGVALVTFGVVIGLKAVFSSDVEGLSEEHIKNAIISAVTVGGGVFLLAKGMLSSIVQSAMVASGSAFIVFGVSVGLKAFLNYQGGTVGEDTIKGVILSAFGIAAGAGIIASALGAAAGVAGFIAGGATILTLGAAVAIKAFLKAKKEDFQGLDLSEEEVQAFVDEQMFTVNVPVIVDGITLATNSVESLQESVRSQISDLTGQMNVLRLGIDKANTILSIQETIGDKDSGLVNAISQLADAKIDVLKLTFANIKAYDSEGNDITADTLLKGINGWNAVKNEVVSMGSEITELLFKSAEGKLDSEGEKYLQSLLEKISEISRAITTSQVAGEALTTLELGIADLSADSAKAVIEKFNEYKSSLETAYRETYTEAIASLNQLSAYYKSIGMPEMAEYYSERAKELSKNFEQAIESALDDAVEPGKAAISEWIKKTFGTNVGEGMDLSSWFLLFETYGVTTDNIKKTIKGIFDAAGMDPYLIDLMDLTDLTGWEMLSEDVQRRLIQGITIEPGTLEAIKEALSLSVEDLITLKGWDTLEAEEQKNFTTCLINAYGSTDVINLLKEKFKMSASDIISVVNWNGFTTSTQLEFMSALEAAFGSSEALSAAQQAGINIVAMVASGMASDDESIKAKAKHWAELITAELSIPNEIDVDMRKSTLEALKKKLRETIKGTECEVNAAAHILINLLTHITAEVEVTTSGAKDVFQRTNIQGVGVTGSGSGLGGNKGGSYDRTANMAKASGAYDIPKGDVFIANEKEAELVGSINGKTSVANQGQIIEGISKGVERANSEQNSLLREQNSLLRSLLEKEMSVNIGASAGLGRTVQRSLDMYSSLVGG